MGYTLHDLDRWLCEPESETLEFKEAKTRYEFDKLVKYCSALANEGGGKMILGVTDRRPRTVVGSSAYPEPGQTVSQLVQKLHLRIAWGELHHPLGRVLVFDVPTHPVGVPVQADGAYYARSGDSLGHLRPEELRKIFDEAGPDYSSELHPSATLRDLDPQTVERFRHMWRRQSGNAALDMLTPEQILSNAELIRDGRLTNAALVFLAPRRRFRNTWPRGKSFSNIGPGRHPFLTSSASNTGKDFWPCWTICGRKSTSGTRRFTFRMASS